MSGLLEAAGSLALLVGGFLIATAFAWFVLSYWLDGVRLILVSVGIAAVASVAQVLRTGDGLIDDRAVGVAAVLVTALVTAALCLRARARQFGPANG